MFARPACGLRSPLAATASGQVLSPGFSTRLPGLQMTRRHQGFIRIRPSGLPLARSLPRTERGPLGFFPELRTPTGRTRRRTSGRGSVTNTNRELRDRHHRPPIHELTHMRDIASHPQVLTIARASWRSGSAVQVCHRRARTTRLRRAVSWRAPTRGSPHRGTRRLRREQGAIARGSGGCVVGRSF